MSRPEGSRGSGQRILYLDDEEGLVRAVSRSLKGLRYKVDGFTQASQALAAFREAPESYALALLDHDLPGTSGVEVARRLLELRPSLPVTLSSGFVTEELLANAGTTGIREVLHKPTPADELARVVYRLVTGRQADPPAPRLPDKPPTLGPVSGFPRTVSVPVRVAPGDAARGSLEELWTRHQGLVSALANIQVHDLNNLLAVVQANTFLLRDCTAKEALEAARAIEEAAAAGAALVERARAFKPARPASVPPVNLESALALVKPLLQRLGRDDVVCQLKVAAEANALQIDAMLVDKVFLTLVVLALELLPAHGTLAVVAGPRHAAATRTPGAVISLVLAQPQVPAYLNVPRNNLENVAEVAPVALARALALHRGGDVTVRCHPKRGLTLELVLPVAAASSPMPSSLGP